jgi:hypothetical protein
MKSEQKEGFYADTMSRAYILHYVFYCKKSLLKKRYNREKYICQGG